LKFSKLLELLLLSNATIDDLLSLDLSLQYYTDKDSVQEILRSFGLPIMQIGDVYTLSTLSTDFKDQEFCFIDIETNGSKPQKSQIIELAAIKTRGSEVVDTFDTMVYCENVSDMISEITGIKVQELADKPKESVILERFRAFLGDAVFVAHSVEFDYSFISASMQKYDLPPLLNRKLCTIDLAKRTIEAEKYGLKSLADALNLEGFLHHRAYSDAKASLEIFKRALENLPESVNKTEQLIDFTKSSVSLTKEVQE
jgi:DNA polymerase III subunit epsilon